MGDPWVKETRNTMPGKRNHAGRAVGLGILAVVACCGLATSASAQSLEELGISTTALHLQSGVVDTSRARMDLAALVAQQPEGATVRRVIQLDGPMTRERHALLQDAGVQLHEYLPMYAYVADFSNADAVKVAGLNFIRWHSEYQTSWKFANDLAQRTYNDPALKEMRENGVAPLHISLFEGADPNFTSNAIAAMEGVTVVETWMQGDTPMLAVAAPEAALAQIGELNDVAFIENAPEATLRNNNVRWIVQTNVLNNTSVYTNGLTGSGQIIGVMDGQVAQTHCSFSDPGVPIGPGHRKIVYYNSVAGANTHGTHVAGTALGDGGSFSATRGVAYNAKLAYSPIPGFNNQNDFVTRLTNHHNAGARVHTNSWGDDGSTSYTGWCRAIDVFSRNFEESVVIFACTNGFSLRTPENAKNVLAVAATGPNGQQHLHCSGGQGPTSDGRRKPEIMAPGCSTISSTGTSCGTGGLSGTSMATPAVAGATALARQYYVEGYYPGGQAGSGPSIIPSGALLRATIINSGADMTGVTGYPSNREGWGRMLLENVLHFSGDARSLLVFDVRNNDDDALSTGESNVHTFKVDSASEQLRVTMSFTDVPANVGAAMAPINNIDLEVTSPTGTVYRGNVFAAGVSTTGGAFDAINSTEQVHVNNPTLGEWTIRVIGTAVNQSTQGYAIVVTGAVSEAAACAADFNGDGMVNGADLATLLSNWGVNTHADLTGDGVVNGADLANLLSLWGDC